MCDRDPKTHVITSDCGSCGCGQSTNAGNHTYVQTGTVKVGDTLYLVYQCKDCNAYK